MPPLVYHYTTSAGLLGIISSGCIWMTDVEFMNDTQEVRYAQAGMLEAMRARIASFGDTYENGYSSPEGSRALVLTRIADDLQRTTDSGKTWHAYAACFCEDGDLLSQWRGYAGASGFAVGYSTAQLTAIAEEVNGQFAGVEYGPAAAQEQIGRLLEGVTPGSSGTGHPQAKANFFLMRTVLPGMVLIKDPAFSEEREWRLSRFAWGTASDLRFRPGAFGVIPYLETAFSSDAIQEVVIGPGNHTEVRAASVRQLLDHHELRHVTVRTSRAPFRS